MAGLNGRWGTRNNAGDDVAQVSFQFNCDGPDVPQPPEGGGDDWVKCGSGHTYNVFDLSGLGAGRPHLLAKSTADRAERRKLDNILREPAVVADMNNAQNLVSRNLGINYRLNKFAIGCNFYGRRAGLHFNLVLSFVPEADVEGFKSKRVSDSYLVRRGGAFRDDHVTRAEMYLYHNHEVVLNYHLPVAVERGDDNARDVARYIPVETIRNTLLSASNTMDGALSPDGLRRRHRVLDDAFRLYFLRNINARRRGAGAGGRVAGPAAGGFAGVVRPVIGGAGAGAGGDAGEALDRD